MGRRVVVVVLVVSAAAAGAAVAQTTADLLSKAQSLAWSKQFDEAARIYEQVLTEHPDSRDAAAGLAQVRLWQGRYAEARRRFRAVLAAHPNDADAQEGAASAAYWSGDYRTAEREFRALVAAHPERENARRSLVELRSASETVERVETDVIDDDQPFRGTRSEARVSMFTDPLTRWDASLGTYTLRSDIGGKHGAPFALIQNETVLPAVRLTLTASLGGLRTPDHRTRAIGGASARVRMPRRNSVVAGITRREILTNATKLYPFVDVASLRWDHAEPWLASAAVEHDRFSDRNSANAADAYALIPVWKPGKWTFWSGVSALSRDTAESRFFVEGISAIRDPSGSFFHYTYRGAYDPYWTPHDLFEARLILAVERRSASRTTVRLQGDSGRAHDRAVGFFPDAGLTSFPTEIGRIFFTRSYNPWRIRFTSSTAIAHGMTLDVGYEHSVTAFYRANSFHATLARRR